MKKTKLDSFLKELRESGWNPTLSAESYDLILETGIRGKNIPLAFVAAQIALHERPITLRGLFYRVVSAGFLPSTDREHYARLGRLMTVLREAGTIPFSWIVDNVRETMKPSSWSGLADFMETVRNAYRKDFWERLPDYVHFFVEKDAVCGTIHPVTREYDVALSPIRGYCSLSFAHAIAETWNKIEKPLFAFYLGDYDPSGFDLERDLREKLFRYSQREFTWQRLAVVPEDFDAWKLIPLKAKKSDRRYANFVEEHGTACAELDAIPPTELRSRVKDAIEAHIPQDEWRRLQLTEKAERESLAKVVTKFGRMKAG